jgi:DNA polymerase III delta subunit
VAKLHELVDLADHPPELITYFVADMVRKLHHAAVMSSQRINDFTIFSTLKVWPRERQAPFLAAARRLGAAGAARLLEQLVEMDRRAKSGYADATLNLEAFCLRLAGAVR